jgi:hypothetical protein
VYTHTLKRDILVGVMREMPVPHAQETDINRVVSAARNYLEAAKQFDPSIKKGSPRQQPFGFAEVPIAGFDEASIHLLLKRLDAEVLRLYDLPARAERRLLDLFAGIKRPGVPGNFLGYYPEDFQPCVPLYAFLSDAYQRFLQDASPALPERQQSRYDTLADKKHSGHLTAKEADELHSLQAEIDGRDYALHPPDDRPLKAMENDDTEAASRLDAASRTLIDVSLARQQGQ